LQEQISICEALEAKLETAEKVLSYCRYNLQLTMQICIQSTEEMETLLAKRADNSAEIARLIHQLHEQAALEEERDLVDAASPRWSFAEYYGELLRQIVDGHGSSADTTNIILPLLLDNASWEAFVEFLRAEVRLAKLGLRFQEGMIGRTRELVRQNQLLKTIIAERKRLQERLSQLSSVIDNASDAIVICTMGGTIVSWNAAAESLYGYRAGEVLGRSRFMLTDNDRADDVPALAEQLKRQEKIGVCEALHIRKNGKPVRVSMALSPVKDMTGQIVGFAVITREMGDSKAGRPSKPVKVVV
jgi:PAS domain S-box-containing protein